MKSYQIRSCHSSRPLLQEYFQHPYDFTLFQSLNILYTISFFLSFIFHILQYISLFLFALINSNSILLPSAYLLSLYSCLYISISLNLSLQILPHLSCFQISHKNFSLLLNIFHSYTPLVLFYPLSFIFFLFLFTSSLPFLLLIHSLSSHSIIFSFSPLFQTLLFSFPVALSSSITS